MEQLHIIHLNCRSFSWKESLEFFLSKNKVSVAALSETWCKSYSKVNFKGCNLFRADRKDGFNGNALICEEWEIANTDTYVEICGVKINLAIPLPILLVYCAPNGPIDISLLKNINFKDDKVLICGDFNSHHIVWDSAFVYAHEK